MCISYVHQPAQAFVVHARGDPASEVQLQTTHCLNNWYEAQQTSLHAPLQGAAT